MMPPDFRTITGRELDAVRALKLTGVGFHIPGDTLATITSAACARVRRTFQEAGMDLVQVGIGYRSCLFAPDDGARNALVATICRGLEVCRELGAHTCLIRTGSLNPAGPYSPDRANLTLASRERLVESLRRIADVAEAVGQTVVIETHLLTIMDSPETNREILAAVASPHIQVVMDYVNHFQTLHQVYHSTARLNHIFDVMGPISGVGHCKDIRIGPGLVLHIDEAGPGEGELDLATALRRWHHLYPDGYMLLEHLPDDQYPLASRNVHRIAAEAGVPIT
ncbi:hypothetical protein RY27_24995 [Litorilinea aerophila]|nr:hypothetical protein RY27_24995 [Litorilinea aerophila]